MEDKVLYNLFLRLAKSYLIGILLALPVVIYIVNNSIQRSKKHQKLLINQQLGKQNAVDTLNVKFKQ